MLLLCLFGFFFVFWLRLARHRSCRAARRKHDDMIRLNNCIPGPVYPLSTERTESQSGAGHKGGSALRGCISLGLWHRNQNCALLLASKCGIEQDHAGFCSRFSLYFTFSGGTKNDVVDGPCVQIHQLWPSVPDPWGLLHQTGKSWHQPS